VLPIGRTLRGVDTVPFVVRLPCWLAGRIRRIVRLGVCSSIGDLISTSIALRCLPSTENAIIPTVLLPTRTASKTSLMKGYIPRSREVLVRETASVSGTSIGRLVAEGVQLFVAAHNIHVQRGIRSLARGPKTHNCDFIIVLDDDLVA
jgi:hypothetical protein